MKETEKATVFSRQAPLPYSFNGFGVQWDEFLNTENCRGSHVTVIPEAADFDLICRRAINCGVKKIRMFFHNGLTKSAADAPYTFDDPYVRDSIKLLDFCQRENIRVCVMFVDCISFDEDGKRNLWKCEAEPYADTVLHCVQYLLETGHYTCIREISCLNEPDVDIDYYRYSFSTYYEACRKVAAGLEQLGLRERVLLNLSDNRCGFGMQNFISGLGSLGDMYNNHNYLNSKEDTNEMLTFITKMGVCAAKQFDKPFVIAEFGWDNGLTNWTVGFMDSWGQTGIETYSRGLFLARYAIQALNTGAVGVSYRSLYDTYYEPKAEKKWTAGLFGYKDENWGCRPQYYAYGLLMKYADIGAKIYPLQSDSEVLVGALLHNPDGSFTLLAANAGQENEAFRLSLPADKDLQFRVYAYRQGKLPGDDRLPACCGVVSTENALLQSELPGNSFFVFTTK